MAKYNDYYRDHIQLSETPISHDQTISNLNDKYQVSATVVDSKLLDQWLSGLGGLVISQQKTDYLQGQMVWT